MTEILGSLLFVCETWMEFHASGLVLAQPQLCRHLESELVGGRSLSFDLCVSYCLSDK